MRKLIPIAVLACVITALASLHFPAGSVGALFFSSPNLIVEFIDAPDSAHLGDTVPVSNTIKNQIDPSECDPPGSCDAGAFKVKFYLSTDTVITTTDVFLGQRIITSLLAGESDPAIINLALADGISLGDYYLGAIADADNEVTETDETDNTGYDLITIQGRLCFLPATMRNSRPRRLLIYLPVILKGYSQ